MSSVLSGVRPSTQEDGFRPMDCSLLSMKVERGAMRQPVVDYRPPASLFVVCHGWPCWLPSILSLRLSLIGAFFPEDFHKYFPPLPSTSWGTIAAWYREVSFPPKSCIVLASGSFEFFRRSILPKLSTLRGPLVFAMDAPPVTHSKSKAFRFWARKEFEKLGLQTDVMHHSEFGGASNASHLLAYSSGVPNSIFRPGLMVPRTLKQLLDSTVKGAFTEIPPPPAIPNPARRPILVEGRVMREGLYDVARPRATVACPSVFSTTKWVARQLTTREILRVFDLPVSMDRFLLPDGDQRAQVHAALVAGIRASLSPLVITNVFRAWWGMIRGGSMDHQDGFCTSAESTEVPPRSRGDEMVDDWEECDLENDGVSDDGAYDPDSIDTLWEDDERSVRRRDEALCWDDERSIGSSADCESHDIPDLLRPSEQNSTSSSSDDSSDERSAASGSDDIEETATNGGASAHFWVDFAHIQELRHPLKSNSSTSECKGSVAARRPGANSRASSFEPSTTGPLASPTAARLDHIKEEHDLAKAVKPDDAKVPVHLWDERIIEGPLSERQQGLY